MKLRNLICTAMLIPVALGSFADVLLETNFDGASASGTQLTSVTWTQDAAISGKLTGSTTINGTHTLDNTRGEAANNVTVDNNLNITPLSTPRGITASFTTTEAFTLNLITIGHGHTNNVGGNQAFASDMKITITDTTNSQEKWTNTTNYSYDSASPWLTTPYDLSSTPVALEASTSYTISVSMFNMPGGGAFATWNSIKLEGAQTPVNVEITGYNTLDDLVVRSGDTAVDTLAEVQALLNSTYSTVTIANTADTRDVTWTTNSAPSYNNASNGTYVFTATLGAIPSGYTDETAETVTANVIVTDTFGLEITDGSASILSGVRSPGNLNGADMTAMGWFYVDTSAPRGCLFELAETSSSTTGVGIWVTGSGGKLEYWDGTNYRDLTNPINENITFPIDQWVHFAVTISTTATSKVYINGVETDSTRTIVAPVSNALLSLGATVGNADKISGVTYDEVAVFSSALTSAQITEIYNSGTGAELDSAYAGMELYWRFEDEPQGTSVADSDNGNDSAGTISGTQGTSFRWVAGKSVGTVVTPAIGLQVSLEGTELVWTVEDEVSIKEYRVINAETKEVLEVVLAVEADFYSVEIPEGIEVELVVVDESGFSKPYAPQDGNVKIEIYDLEEGWNLIAITSDDADLETLKDETVGVLWGWNGSAYEVIEAAEATDAVWVYSPIEKQVYVSGTKSDAEIKLNLGWNMVGPVENDYIPADADTAYSWSEVYDVIAGEDKVLIGGKGYWIFSL